MEIRKKSHDDDCGKLRLSKIQPLILNTTVFVLQVAHRSGKTPFYDPVTYARLHL